MMFDVVLVNAIMKFIDNYLGQFDFAVNHIELTLIAVT
jgi:hypothetical protein